MRFEAQTEEEMIGVGRRIARALPQQAVVILTGDLGAGKTTLAKGLAAERAQVPAEEVSSPTFTLIHEYGDPVAVCHADLYRLETDAEVLGLGLEEYFDRPILTLIEWGERFEHLLAEPLHRISISAIPLFPDTSRRQVICTFPAPSPAVLSSLA
jgi:tRNA threonylcarbamoyladenosine biosynthesis protein TsaE